MNHREATLPQTCANCANWTPREVSKRERRQARRKERRSNGGHRFHFAAPSYQHSAAVVADGPQVNAAPLQPGQGREVVQNRAESWGDVVTYALKGAAIGAAGLGICVPFAVWVDAVPWYAPFVIAPCAGGLGILYSVINPQEWLVAKLEDWLDRDLDGDGQVGAIGYDVRGTLDNEQGRTLYLNFKLEGENAHLMWHRFCRAVTYQDRNFSETEATKRQGITPDDWTRIYQAFTAQHWLQPAGKRGTPKLINEGPKWVRLYADNPPRPDGHGLSGRLYGDR